MLVSIAPAFRQLFSPPFRATLLRSLGLTLLLLACLWIGLDKALIGWLGPLVAPWPWAAAALDILTGLGLVVAMVFLVAPISMLVAGFFLDDLAALAEREADPAGPVGRPLPTGQALWLASRFALVSLGVNLVALLLLLVPFVNAIAFFAANAYLFSREYFELAAMRYRPVEEARALRRRYAPYILLCGLPIAVIAAIPVVNLLTPLFGVAYMVRIHKRLSRAAPMSAGAPAPQAR